ncbi:MAG: hypothetical protein ACREBO_12760 [Novosphingobium sp.]
MTAQGSCSRAEVTEDRADNHDSVESPLFLIDNYILAYGCALAEASNGRQLFQIPSHLAALTGVIGGAFGGGRDLALASGIAASTFNSGNAYWAPQDKAVIIDSAYDAILCIRTEAVGIDFIETRDAPAEVVSGDAVELKPQWRYFGLISAALRQVDRIAATRLRASGKFDPAGLVAEIEALNKKIEEAEAAKKEGEAPAADPSPSPSPSPTPSGAPPGMGAGADNGGGTNSAVDEPAGTGSYRLELGVLQPKIQRCVVRAKL